jgi:hypothetical protein
VSRSGSFALPVIGLTSGDATVVSAHPTAIDHIAPSVVIVHAPPRDMQVQRVVEGFRDAQQLSAGLSVGVGEVVMKRLGEFFLYRAAFRSGVSSLERALEQIVLELDGPLTRSVVEGDVVQRVLVGMNMTQR